MALATILGSDYGNTPNRSGSAYVLNLPAGIPTGSWVLLLLNQNSNSSGMAVPAWTTMLTATTMNTRRIGIWGFVKDATETVSISWPATMCLMKWLVVWGVGPAPSTWQIGTGQFRVAYGNVPRNWARGPSVNAASNNSLALMVGFEATNAVESPNTILSVDNGFSEVVYAPQMGDTGSLIETIWVGSKSVAAGETGLTTVLYRNAQDLNAYGIQLVIPPTPDVAKVKSAGNFIGTPVKYKSSGIFSDGSIKTKAGGSWS